MSTRSEPGWLPQLREAARQVREQVGLPAVARAVGLDSDSYLAWEAGDPAAPRVDVDQLARTFGLDLDDARATSYTRSSRSLSRLWSTWGPQGRAPLAGLEAVAEWARVDDRMTLYAEGKEPRDPANASLVDRGVPEAASTIFTAHTLPELTLSSTDGDATDTDVTVDVAAVAGQFRGGIGVKPGVAVDPWQIADERGVAAGLAPLGTGLYSVTIRVGDGFAVVVSSDLPESVRRRALMHALVHLAAGDILLANCQWGEDRDDDSIYGCSPMPWQRCVRVLDVVEDLLDPVAAATARAEYARIRVAIDAGTYSGELPPPPAPVRSEGELPGSWEIHEVFVPRVSLRRELGRINADALVPGAGECRWPASLARRWVAVVSRGFSQPVSDVEQFPFDRPGCPTVADVEQALWRERIVRAQLAAHYGGPA